MTMSDSVGQDSSKHVSDPRRLLWPLCSAAIVLTPIWSILAWHATGGAIWTAFLPLMVIYLLIPLLDAIVGEDESNLGESVLQAMAKDPFYMRAVYAVIPFGYLTFIGAVGFVMLSGLPLWAKFAFMSGTATLNGSMIIIGHELGHKTGRLDRLMAKLALGVVGYGHFTAEHNLGHHKNVSTPADCASGRFGESVYEFALRELLGALCGGWAIEQSRLERRGLRVWSQHNEILQADAITLGVAIGLVLVLGVGVLPWILLHHFLAWFALTLVNYIEHYGLLRGQNEDGRYEPCTPRHSWNANHIVSNLLQFHLQRHSDHHAHPLRPYQALRHFDDSPQLPTGYPGCMLMAMIPPVWFKVMDPRVIKWAEGDLSRTNIHGPARERLERRWGVALGG